jgi:hypothetical protein
MTSGFLLEDNTKKKDFVIKYPSTTHDDGSQSEDVFHDCRRVMLLIEDERLLVARALYSTISSRLENHPGRNLKATQMLVKQQILNKKKVKKVAELQKEEYLAIQKYLEEHKETLIMMEVSYSSFVFLRFNFPHIAIASRIKLQYLKGHEIRLQEETLGSFPKRRSA